MVDAKPRFFRGLIRFVAWRTPRAAPRVAHARRCMHVSFTCIPLCTCFGPAHHVCARVRPTRWAMVASIARRLRSDAPHVGRTRDDPRGARAGPLGLSGACVCHVRSRLCGPIRTDHGDCAVARCTVCSRVGVSPCPTRRVSRASPARKPRCCRVRALHARPRDAPCRAARAGGAVRGRRGGPSGGHGPR